MATRRANTPRPAWPRSHDGGPPAHGSALPSPSSRSWPRIAGRSSCTRTRPDCRSVLAMATGRPPPACVLGRQGSCTSWPVGSSRNKQGLPPVGEQHPACVTPAPADVAPAPDAARAWDYPGLEACGAAGTTGVRHGDPPHHPGRPRPSSTWIRCARRCSPPSSTTPPAAGRPPASRCAAPSRRWPTSWVASRCRTCCRCTAAWMGPWTRGSPGRRTCAMSCCWPRPRPPGGRPRLRPAGLPLLELALPDTTLVERAVPVANELVTNDPHQ